MPRIILQSRAAQLPQRLGTPDPDPGFFEGASAAFSSSANADGGIEARQQEALNNANAQIVDELNKRGLPNDAYTTRDSHSFWSLGYDEKSIWAGIAAARAKDKKAFSSLPATPEEFRARTIAPVNERIARETDTTRRSGWGGWLTGSFGYGLTDPINQAAMLTGAGEAKTFGGALLNDAVLNAKITAAQQPALAFERAKRGEKFSAGEAAQNVLLGGAIGGVAGGVLKGVELHVAAPVGNVLASGREAGIAAVWDHLPQAVRDRWGSAANVKPDDMPDIAEMVIGKGNMSADEKAAAMVVRREADIAAANPYEPNGAGIATHQSQMADAMNRILAVDPPAPPRQRFAGELRGGTSLGSGVVPDLSARAAVKNRIGVVENATGGGTVRNPLSTATGKYQFVSGTWKSYYLRRFGRGDLTDAQILAKRSDGRLQDVLMDDMLDDNANFLRRQGEAETAGNLYLTHFAGQAGAKKLFEADPRASAESVLGESVMRANPFLRGKTAEDVIRWAHERMGDGSAPRGARPRADSAEAPGTVQLQGEINRLAADIGTEDAPVFVDTADVAMPREDGPREDGLKPEIADALPKLREIVNDRTRSINETDKIAAELGLPASDVRRGLIELATRREIVMRRDGGFSRAPQSTGPVDALKFIARMGVSDHEGHALGRNGRDLNIFVPGAGPLVRKSGKSVDAIGEALHDAGYFGPPSVVPRPDENAVLDMIERAGTGEKIWPHGQAPEAAPAGQFLDAVERQRLAGLFGAHASDIGVAVDDGLLHAAGKVYDGLDPATASPRDSLLHAVYAAWEDLRSDVWHETKDSPDAIFDNGLDAAFDGHGGQGRELGGGSDAFPGDAGQGGAHGAAVGTSRDLPDLSPISPEAAKAYEDPIGPAAQAEADSLLHDARAAVDPAIAAKEAEQARLKAASPMRARTDQESTIGAPLFDAADQTRFKLDDVEGPGMTLAEMLDHLDNEEAVLKSIEDCL